MKTLESSDPSLGLWPRLRRKLLAPETRLLLFWPVFELAFMALERLRPEDTQYFVMHCPLDDCIPFFGSSTWAGRWHTPTSGRSRPSGG